MPSDKDKPAADPESSAINAPETQQNTSQQPASPLFTRRQSIQLGLAGLVSLAGGIVIVSEVARRYGLTHSSATPIPQSSAMSVAQLQTATSQGYVTATTRPATATAQPSVTPSPQPNLAEATPDALETPGDPVTSETPEIATSLVSIPKPSIITHTEWGGVTPTMPFVPHQIERITLHHEGVYFDGSIPAAQYLRQVQHWCLTDRMWPDIPYHFLIDLEGLIYEGRPLDAQGDTNTGYNTSGHAQVAVLGKYDAGEQVPAEVQINSVIAIMAWIAYSYAIPPDADHIKGHRDYIPVDPVSGYHIDTRTGEKITCPGDNLYIYLENGTIHDGVAQRLRDNR